MVVENIREKKFLVFILSLHEYCLYIEYFENVFQIHFRYCLTLVLQNTHFYLHFTINKSQNNNFDFSYFQTDICAGHSYQKTEKFCFTFFNIYFKGEKFWIDRLHFIIWFSLISVQWENGISNEVIIPLFVIPSAKSILY